MESGWFLVSIFLAVVSMLVLELVFGWRLRRRISPDTDDKQSPCCRFSYLSLKERATLAASMPADHQGDDAEGIVTIRKSDLKRALQILDARLVALCRIEGSQDLEVVWHRAGKRTARSAHTVTASAPLGVNTKAVLVKVRELLLPVVGENIVVHSGGNVCAPIDDENYHLFLCSSASNESLQDAPPAIWGVPLQGCERAFCPTGRGIPFIDRDTGFVVAEQIGNCLYLLADVLHVWPRRGVQVSTFTRWRRKIGPLWGEDPHLALLVRVLERIASEYDAATFLGSILKRGRPCSGNFKIDFAQWRQGRQDVVRLLVDSLLMPVLQSDIVIVDAGGQAKPPISSGSFHIFLDSCAAGRPVLDNPLQLWGQRLPSRQRCFAPSALGVPIVDETGFVVGELLHRNLYILHPCAGFSTKPEAAVLAKTLEKVSELLPSFGQMTIAELNQEIARQYAQQCRRSLAQLPAAPKTEPAVLQSRYDTLLRGALDAARECKDALAGNEFGREYDAIMNNPKVKSVHVEGTCLSVSTRTIYCWEQHARKLYEIGEFEILIPLSPSGAVIWRNQTRRIHGYNAPHVNDQGLACLGNMKAVFPALIKDKAYAAAIEAAIAFVEAVNVDDNWGRNIIYWPEAPEAVAKAAGRVS